MKIEEVWQRWPLSRFSIYTDAQVRALRSIAAEIFADLDSMHDGEGHINRRFQHAWDLAWLWTLGAYEVVRAMDQAKGCFSDEVASRLRRVKADLALVRIPFAKQELRGKGEPVYAELSLDGFGPDCNDLCFEIENQVVSVRKLIADTLEFFDGIKVSDVVRAHPCMYTRPRT